MFQSHFSGSSVYHSIVSHCLEDVSMEQNSYKQRKDLHKKCSAVVKDGFICGLCKFSYPTRSIIEAAIMNTIVYFIAPHIL